jgi:hypothetical protein
VGCLGVESLGLKWGRRKSPVSMVHARAQSVSLCLCLRLRIYRLEP